MRMAVVSDPADPSMAEAFSGNRLLATIPADQRPQFEAQGEMIELATGDVVLTRGKHVDSTLFPVGPTTISLVIDADPGRSIEVASIGREGAVGGIVSCGHAPAFTRAEVRVAGRALKLPMTALEEAKKGSDFIANLFCRYSDYLLAQVMQSVACNAFHPIQERAARWLLTTHDRAGSRIELTQEALAGLLGAQRTTVNAVIRALDEEGLVRSRRGVVQVVDREALEARACPCHGVVERHFANVIGERGRGG